MRYASVVQLDRASDSGSECWGFESLRACQIRVDRKVYPDLFFIFIVASVANQASCLALAFLGRDPQRSGVPPARRPALRLRACQARIDRKVYPSFFFCGIGVLPPIRLRALHSPFWEGTRSGPVCPRHTVLRFFFGFHRLYGGSTLRH